MSRFIITSGPTREYFDPIRFLSNPSTGRMGHSIAQAAIAHGHEVIYISGPVAEEFSRVQGATNISIVSTLDLLAAVEKSIAPGSILIMAAAPADYRPEIKSPIKLKKTESPQLRLVPNPDILKCMAEKNKSMHPPAVLIGFAAETHDTERYAREKLVSKSLDMIFLNDVSKSGVGFASTSNEITLFFKNGDRMDLPMEKKETLGEKIIVEISRMIHNR